MDRRVWADDGYLKVNRDLSLKSQTNFGLVPNQPVTVLRTGRWVSPPLCVNVYEHPKVES